MPVRDIQAWNVSMLDINNAPIAVGGLITELELPKLEREFDTNKRAGEAGIIPRPKFFNELEASFTIMSISEEFLKAILENVVKPVTFNLTASAADVNGSAVTFSVTMRGFYNELDLGKFSDTETELNISMMLSFLSETFGTQTMTYDPANYIYSVNGTNLLAGIKTTLGL